MGRKTLAGQRLDSRGAAFKELECSRVPCVVGNRERRGCSDRVRVLVLVFSGATRQPAGGGSGGKLDGRKSGGTTDGGVKDGRTAGSVEHEGVGPDDVTGGGTWIGPGLHFDGSAGVATGCNIAEELSVTGPGLSLPPAPEVAASRDDEGDDKHGQDR